MSREMKDSGIDWIGKIPRSWSILKNKYLYSVKGGNGFPISLQGKETGDYPFCKNSDINHSGDYVKDAVNWVSYDDVRNNNFYIAPKGSILYGKIGEAFKKNHRKINSIPCCFDNNVQASIPISDMYQQKYGYYVYKSIDMKNFDNQGTIPTINNLKFLNEYFPLPNIIEQNNIADFLDKKCSQIDEISKKIQEEIDTLKEYKKSVITEAVTKGLDPKVEMKDSGIEELGIVPTHWKRIQLEYCAKIVRGGSPRPIESYMSDDDTGINWIKIGDTVKGEKYIEHIKEKIKVSGLSKTRKVNIGDLLLTNSMSFGEPYILKVDGCIHDGWLAFTSIKYVDKVFLYYFLFSDACKTQFEKLSDGGVVQNLNIDKVKHTIIYYPGINEQKKIVDFLDEKCRKTNELINTKQQQLETLEQYKKSLIYEYVTGKKEIIYADC